MYVLNTTRWHLLRLTHLLGGLFGLTGVLLSLLIHPAWLTLSILVGGMQVLFALTGYCPSAILLARLGVPQTESCPSKQ